MQDYLEGFYYSSHCSFLQSKDKIPRPTTRTYLGLPQGRTTWPSLGPVKSDNGKLQQDNYLKDNNLEGLHYK